ncbi:MAG: GAF domain-containing protein [Cyanophyceae cyanobacterium]
MVHANQLFCRIDGLTAADREQRRIEALNNLGLLNTATVPVFDEATQTAARFIDVPICIFGLMVHDELWLKSAVGLSRLGLMNPLAAQRKILRQDAFCTYVLDSGQNLAIEDTLNNSIFAQSVLVQHYGIRAYLGTPLVTSSGQSIGTLAVMGLEPHSFTERDAEFLALTARWCLGEFERDSLLKLPADQQTIARPEPSSAESSQDEPPEATFLAGATPYQHKHFWYAIGALKVTLLEQLTEKLRTPLTSVIGMASILRQEVYGALTIKQKEYLEIIHGSGQQMLALMEEIVRLGHLSDGTAPLEIGAVDVGMLCQQAVNRLLPDAKQQQQEICLTVEPGNRVWFLDKEKVHQALYYLIACIINSAEADSQINVHVSLTSDTVGLAVWGSHSWLGDRSHPAQLAQLMTRVLASESLADSDSPANSATLTSSLLLAQSQTEQSPLAEADSNLLGLLLSCRLVELHGGKIIVQKSPQSGYCYVMQLPKIDKEGCH